MKNKFNPETARFYTLNNSGSRGVRIDTNGNRETLPVQFEEGEKVKQIAVRYWEQIGNFSVAVVRYGKREIKVFPDSDVEPIKYEPYFRQQERDKGVIFSEPYEKE